MRATIQPGDRFGRLTVTSTTELVTADRSGRKQRRRRTYCLCECQCGTQKTIRSCHLLSGRVVSCGCYGRTLLLQHGGYRTPEYRAWTNMRRRCLVPGHQCFHNYGGRGITICEAWNSFEQFLRDMGERPSPEHTLDRIDNDGPYAPENCRWATRGVQTRNRRVTRMLTLDGHTKPLIQWAEEAGISVRTVEARLHYGWPAADAVFTPVHR